MFLMYKRIKHILQVILLLKKKKKKKDCPVGFSKIVWRSGEFLVSLPCALEPSSWPGLPPKW